MVAQEWQNVIGLDARIVSDDGELLRHLVLDPTKDYRSTGKPPGRPRASTMS